MTTRHTSAKASHYNYSADKYDAIYDKYAEIENEVIADILRKHKVNTVLDLTCGTGAQVVYLAQNDFDVTGSDINQKMLAIAKEKVKKLGLKSQLFIGDMRATRAGKFDSVITIFNAIGHLTKSDYKKALKNINWNLKAGGIYIFAQYTTIFMFP